MAAMPGPFGPLADPALQHPHATPLRPDQSPQAGGTELRSVPLSAPAGNLRATSWPIVLSPSQQKFADKLQAAQELAYKSTKLPDAGAPNMEVKNEPMLHGDVKRKNNEAKMPDFHGRANERDISFEEHAEEMLTLSAEHDEELRAWSRRRCPPNKIRSRRLQMLARRRTSCATHREPTPPACGS